MPYDDYDPYEYEPDPPEKVLCKECDEYVEPYFVDEGIGSYEYWGYKGNDVHLVPYCPLCRNELES